MAKITTFAGSGLGDYTENMIHLARVTTAPKPKTKDSRRIAVFYAGLLVIMAVAQLFTFEDFTQHMINLGAPWGEPLAVLFAALIVAVEVFALPFLLGMSLSRPFRWLSMICGWLAAAFWLKISIWILATSTTVDTVGFLGTLVDLMPGWWAVFMSFAFVVMAVWSSWGLWPGKARISAGK